ncbi:hypothetical protein [Rhodococcus artemisiae]|uniref:Uncharacterized protein n=1 Tax=Rhodococcus artemisiae TaxID=714159 RepID=A0ABU7LCE9_9NOCA|nr:hypothetical protein [Rhodococcus artemisiae]MEE2058942.1 hypothetical protein [Rhodococcus artemisiae]
MTDLLNHRDLSAVIDAWAASITDKPPLQRDPRLWDLFEEDRRIYGIYSQNGRKGGRPKRGSIPVVGVDEGGCRECGRKMRPRRTSLSTHPDTVSPGANGLCAGCYIRPAQRGAE